MPPLSTFAPVRRNAERLLEDDRQGLGYLPSGRMQTQEICVLRRGGEFGVLIDNREALSVTCCL